MDKWKHIIVGVILGTFLYGCCVTSKPQVIYVSPPSVAEKKEPQYYRSTVKLEGIYVAGDQSFKAAASGFAIDFNHILTAGHFCAGVQGLEQLEESVGFISAVYVNNNHRLGTIFDLEIKAVDVKKDLCLIKSENHGIVPLSLAKTYKQVNIHDDVTIVGGPLGFFPVTSKGKVVSRRTSDLPEGLNNRLLISALGTFGNSGGPIIDANGNVIGVVMAKLNRYDGLLFGVHWGTVKRFLKQRHGK